MSNSTKFDIIKQQAKLLLNLPIIETDYSPMIVSHPFTSSGYISMQSNGDFEILDITKSEEAFSKWKDIVSKMIDESQSVEELFFLVNKTYSLFFLDLISAELSNEDLSRLLGSVWTSSEFLNMDTNVPKQKILKLFKRADRSSIMSKDEYDEYLSLDNQLVVYRGVTKLNEKKIKVFSWTLSYGKAKWFSERFGEKGKVYSAVIDKNNIFAYFNRRNEDEVVVDYSQLKDIEIVSSPRKLKKSELGDE